MTILICFAACKNNSSSEENQDEQLSIAYSLGNPPDESKRTDKFEVVNDSEGIYLEFDYPESKDYWTTRVYVEGLGTIAEEVQDLDESGKKGRFFYPFVDAGKEYTIRFISLGNEKRDENGFVISGDTTLCWFETKVTAGANSKGEVRFTSKGRISVDKKGNFKFTERPTFQNEKLLDNSWKVEIGLVEGVSWAHGDERKTKWVGSVQIQQADLLKQINFFEKCPWIQNIDFICVRPILEDYEHDGKTYKYQWEGFVEDIFYPSKADSAQTIDKNNPSQAINGTWTQKSEWDETEYYLAKVHAVWNETLVIAGATVKRNSSCTYTKLDGNAFTKEEIVDGWCYDYLSYKLPTDSNDYVHYEEGNFSDDKGNQYKYKIYKLYSNVAISSDNKTLITKDDDEPQSISEYFKDATYTYDDNNHTRTEHKELQVFEDKDLGSELWVIVSGKDNGEDYKYTDIYKKQ